MFDDQEFLEGIQQMFRMEYLESYWRRRSNLDVVLLFVALALLVGETKGEV